MDGSRVPVRRTAGACESKTGAANHRDAQRARNLCVYKERHVIECFVGQIRRYYRRMLSRVRYCLR